jgi:hypothetical protein
VRIACDKCGAAFEAADDQELCAVCRDAAEIGDPYKATPAVMGDRAAERSPVLHALPLATPGGLSQAVFNAFVLFARHFPRLFAQGAVTCIGFAPLVGVLYDIQSAPELSRGEIAFGLVIAVFALCLGSVVELMSYAVAIVHLDQEEKGGATRRTLVQAIGHIVTLRRGEFLVGSRNLTVVNLLILVFFCNEAFFGDGRSVFSAGHSWWIAWGALSINGPYFSRIFIEGRRAPGCSERAPRFTESLRGKDVAVVLLGFLFLIIVYSMIGGLLLSAFPIAGWVAIGLFTALLVGFSSALSFTRYLALRVEKLEWKEEDEPLTPP